jgi:hypothetical protein
VTENSQNDEDMK